MKNSGFTLVEIMIVVAIIGLLAALAVPAFIQAREDAQRNSCVANLDQIEGSIQQWAFVNRKSGSDAVVQAGILTYLSNDPFTDGCPGGGTYAVTTVDAGPSCTLNGQGHILQ